jgi:hypothetical protein
VSAASASTPSRLQAARQRAADAKAALAAGTVVLFSATGIAAAATHSGQQKTSTSVQHQSDDSVSTDDLGGGTLAPASSQPQASTSLS